MIGFDSGATLLNAVRNQWFHGAVTQDPYMIGFYAVELAVKLSTVKKSIRLWIPAASITPIKTWMIRQLLPFSMNKIGLF